MVLLNDETLMAYVDGELDAATASEVEAALVDNAAARETVAMFRESWGPPPPGRRGQATSPGPRHHGLGRGPWSHRLLLACEPPRACAFP